MGAFAFLLRPEDWLLARPCKCVFRSPSASSQSVLSYLCPNNTTHHAAPHQLWNTFLSNRKKDRILNSSWSCHSSLPTPAHINCRAICMAIGLLCRMCFSIASCGAVFKEGKKSFPSSHNKSNMYRRKGDFNQCRLSTPLVERSVNIWSDEASGNLISHLFWCWKRYFVSWNYWTFSLSLSALVLERYK